MASKQVIRIHLLLNPEQFIVVPPSPKRLLWIILERVRLVRISPRSGSQRRQHLRRVMRHLEHLLDFRDGGGVGETQVSLSVDDGIPPRWGDGGGVGREVVVVGRGHEELHGGGEVEVFGVWVEVGVSDHVVDGD